MIGCTLRCLAAAIVSIAVTFMLCVLYYEGVSIPQAVPLIGGTAILKGDVTRRIDAKLQAYVMLSEKTALQATLDETRRKLNAASQSLEEARKRQLAADEADAQRAADHEKAIADDDKNDDGARVTAADREWLRQHR